MSERALQELRAAQAQAQAIRDQHQVTLFVKEGKLYFRNTEGGDSILLVVYAAGDCDTFSWPLDTQYRPAAQQHENICRALYDEREMGNVPSTVRKAMLPDGRVLFIDEEVA